MENQTIETMDLENFIDEAEAEMSNQEHRLPLFNINLQYMNNTKLSRILTTKDYPIAEDFFKIELKIDDNVVNLVNIWHDKHITLTHWDITPFDSAVMDATYTILSSGINYITPEWIAQVIFGYNKSDSVSNAQVEAVTKSIEKLQFIRINIDCTKEHNAYCLKKGEKPSAWWGYESYLLPIGKVEGKYDANGKRRIAYKILEKPALYWYAEMNKQIIKVPACLLESETRAANTNESVLIKRYVVKRVAQIVKKNNLTNNKISFIWFDRNENEERGLFPELGYTPDGSVSWRKKKSRIVKVVVKTLDMLVQGGAIKRYEPYRKDETNNPTSPVIGYKIFYEREESCLSNKRLPDKG